MHGLVVRRIDGKDETNPVVIYPQRLHASVFQRVGDAGVLGADGSVMTDVFVDGSRFNCRIELNCMGGVTSHSRAAGRG